MLHNGINVKPESPVCSSTPIASVLPPVLPQVDIDPQVAELLNDLRASTVQPLPPPAAPKKAPRPAAQQPTQADDTDAPSNDVLLPSLDVLFAEIQATNDKHELKEWVIDNALRFAHLGIFEFTRLKLELSKRGLTSNFVERELKALIKAAKESAAGLGGDEPEQESLFDKCVEDMRELGYSFRMNELDDRVEVNGKVINDSTDAQIIMAMFDKGWNSNGGDGAGYLRLAWKAEAGYHSYNPVKEFLNSLVWDGVDRIAQLCEYVKDKHPNIIYTSGHQAPVFYAWVKRWGIGAAGKALAEGKVRVQNPMLVLGGAQDAGKSTLARFFCPMADEYFIEQHINPESADHHRYLATKLVWEVAELGATTRKADRESLKAFLTKQDATFRTPYARHPVTKPAITSFVGTINPETGFLNDPTGHRRFLPVEITSIDFAYKDNVDPVQLWAQFVTMYRAGEPAALSPEEKEVANTIRTGQEIEDQFVGYIAKYYHIDPENYGTPSDDNFLWSASTADVAGQLTANGVVGANPTNVGISLVKLGLTRTRPMINKVREVRWYGLKRNGSGVGAHSMPG